MSTPPAPPPAPIPNGPNSQYDFIMNPANQPKRGFGNASMSQKIMIVAIGAVGLIIIFVVLFSVVFRSSGGTTTQLTDLAQQQSEIARVSDLGVKQATTTAIKNFAYTTKLTMLSDQQQTLAVLQKSGRKLDQKQLALKTNSVTDQQLKSAAANSTFDSTFKRLITDELKAYRSSLQAYYVTTTGADQKQIMQDSFNNVSLLLGETQTL